MSIWKLGRRQGACVSCDHPFADGETHYSYLFVEEAQLGRRDLCSACWATVELGADQPWWRAKRRERPTGGVQVDLALLEQLFLMSADAAAVRLLELRYLVALLLLRKRRLLLGRVRHDGTHEWLLLRRPRRQEELAVRVFDFAPDQMDGLRTDLERLLEVGSLDDLGPDVGPDDGPDDGPDEGPDVGPDEGGRTAGWAGEDGADVGVPSARGIDGAAGAKGDAGPSEPEGSNAEAGPRVP